MNRSAVLLVCLVAAWPLAASAADEDLNSREMHGRQILTQNCNVCHLPQVPGSATYGPLLNKATANGDDDLMHEIIENGLVRMPAWKYTLSDSDIDDVIDYVRTLPATTASR